MDAKSKANFINSVAAGTTVPCPKCGAANKRESKFCRACGTEIVFSKETKESVPAFEKVNEKRNNENTSTYEEPNSVFAEGLPEWSIEPPQVMVRRHK
ncbi:MAG: zinc ribbon domain-containing protein [Candidatus Limivicinus sp.]|nr:zinc ribbon domain-containing protein [Candidatus Limivicinus sp.]